MSDRIENCERRCTKVTEKTDIGKRKSQVVPLLFVASSAYLFGTAYLYAQSPFTGAMSIGTDRSSDLPILTDILKTAQQLMVFGFGPVSGTMMMIKGIQMIGGAERGEKGPGVLCIICGVALFALVPLITQLGNLFV